MSLLQHVVYAGLAGIVAVTVLRWVSQQISHIRFKRAMGCGDIPRYPHIDRIFGLDIVLGMAKSLKYDYFLVWLNQVHRGLPKTFVVNFLWSRFIWTIEPENMKCMSATNWRDFAVGPMRRNNKATHPFADKGVNTVDGKEWEFSRTLIKPFFVAEGFKNTGRLSGHVDRLFARFPADGETFDIQQLVQLWFLDTTTEFLFGESIGSLEHPERASLCWAMVDVLRGLRLRLQWYKYLFLFRHQSWLDAVAVVHDFLNRHLDRTWRELEEKEEKERANEDKRSRGETAVAERAERTDLLWSMAGQLRDKEALRSQLCLIFVPNNDTTSIFISHILWNLARRPDIYARCRAEVLAHGDAELSFEALRSMKYLNAVMMESECISPPFVDVGNILYTSCMEMAQYLTTHHVK